MKRKFLAFILLVTAGLSLSSCLDSTDNNTNIVYYHDTAITDFSLGKMDKFGKKKDGVSDSLLRGVVDGSTFRFTIDQANHEIYNLDSLPVNTRIAAVLATISAKNSSYIQINYVKQVPVKEGETTDSLVWYNSTDSIDFTKTKEKAIRVYAQDASAYADYKVKVNVHTQRPDTFIWQSLTQANAKLAALNSMKAVSAGGKVVLFGQNAEGALEMFKSENGKQWEEISTTANLGNHAVDNIVAFDNALYVLNPETHQLLKSTDAANWTLVGTFASLKQLIGAGSKTTDAKSTAWCEFLGNLSYPLYITHYPFMYMQMAWVERNPNAPLWMHIMLNIGVIVISIFMAWALLKLYDEPVREWLKHKVLHKK